MWGGGGRKQISELLVGRQDDPNKKRYHPAEEELRKNEFVSTEAVLAGGSGGGGFVRGPSVEISYSGTHRPWRGRGPVLKTNKAKEVSGEKTGAAQMASPVSARISVCV